MRLDAAVERAGVRLIVHDAIGSTNAEALRLGRGGLREPAWIVAREQTAGRGRRGREWRSPRGNLYATLLLADPCAPEKSPQLALVAGVAVHDALAEAAPGLGARLVLKWPNDLLIDDAKLAGILVEGEGSGRDFRAAIGIGVNCASHPEGLAYPATDLRALGHSTAPETVFAALSRTLAERLAEWGRGNGFDSLRQAWLARAGDIGRPLRVRTAAVEIDGAFAGMDGGGALLLRLPSGALRTISSAEVSHPATPAPTA